MEGVLGFALGELELDTLYFKSQLSVSKLSREIQLYKQPDSVCHFVLHLQSRTILTISRILESKLTLRQMIASLYIPPWTPSW